MRAIDLNEPEARPQVGQVFAGRYRIDGELGAGGMSVVFRAWDTKRNYAVAIKVLHPDLQGHEEVIKRFHREMDITQRVIHPNVVHMYRHGHTRDGTLYLVLELVEGRPLDDLIFEEAPIPPDRVVTIIGQIADALATAHAEGVRHRDLKPENIVLQARTDGIDGVKVLDFGLAGFAKNVRSDEITTLGQRLGTPTYMAPETITCDEADHRADLYALGVLMFEMSTGSPPFDGKPSEVFEQHVTTPAPPPSSVEPSVPKWLDDIILDLLEKEPEDRIPSADNLIERLSAAYGTKAIPAPRSNRDWAVLAAVGIATLCIVIAAGALTISAIALLLFVGLGAIG